MADQIPDSTKSRAAFALAASKIDRDARLSDLTDAEIDTLIASTRAAPPGMDREAVEDTARVAAYHAIHGPNGDPFQDPEGYDFASKVADSILSTLSADAIRQGEGWQPIETAVLWDVYVVTDGVNVAMSQYAESDHGDRYWAVEPEDALEWEPTHCIATPASHASDGGKV